MFVDGGILLIGVERPSKYAWIMCGICSSALVLVESRRRADVV